MEFAESILSSISLKDFILWVLAAGSFIIQVNKKIPLNPWTWIFSKLGNALTKDLKVQLDKMGQEQTANTNAIKELKDEVDKKFKEKAADDDAKEASRLRARIIEFADSCRLHQHHTQRAFENIMRDYGDYREYCRIHEIPNHFIDAEYEYINSVYAECQRDNRFL